jgi:hypothetical protein
MCPDECGREEYETISELSKTNRLEAATPSGADT